MTKKFENQYCIHCLGYFEELTDDHIFPKSWYPDSTPENTEKWVAPACFECNNRLGKIEEEAYKKFALSVSKNDIAASGVSEKVTRLYNPSLAKNEKDKRRKEANIRKIIPDLLYTDKMPKAIMKNCGPKKDESSKLYLVYVPFQLINPFAEKLIRGLEFKFRNKLVDPNIRRTQITYVPEEVNNVASAEMQELNDILNRDGIKVDRGPGFVVRHAIDKYDTSLYHITIWGKIEIWGDVSNK